MTEMTPAQARAEEARAALRHGLAEWRALTENHAGSAHLYLVSDSYQASRAWCVSHGVSLQWPRLFIATADWDLFGHRVYPNDRVIRLHAADPLGGTRRRIAVYQGMQRLLDQASQDYRAEVLSLEALADEARRSENEARAEWNRRYPE